MSELLRRRSVLLAEKEVTYDTDPSPTGANAVLVENLEITWPSEIIEPPVLKAGIGPRRPQLARKHGTLTFDVALAGSGSAGTAPEWGPLIQACAFGETIVPATSVTYAPVSTAIASATLYAYRDGKVYKFTGCRGNLSLAFEVGQRPMLSFTLIGHCLDDADAALPTPTLDDVLAPVVAGASFSMGGYASVIANLSIDMQNDVQMTDSVNDASAYGAAVIVGRNPLGSFDPQAVLVSAHDFWSDWEDGTAQALTITTGATAGNIATTTAPACVVREFSEADRNGVLIHEFPFTAAENSGDDEVEIALT